MKEEREEEEGREEGGGGGGGLPAVRRAKRKRRGALDRAGTGAWLRKYASREKRFQLSRDDPVPANLSVHPPGGGDSRDHLSPSTFPLFLVNSSEQAGTHTRVEETSVEGTTRR